MVAMLLASALCAASASGGASVYRVDPSQSLLVARTYKAGFTKGLAHDHAIRANPVSGTIAYVPGHPEEDKVQLTVPTDGLVVDDEKARQAAHLGPGPNEKQRRDIDKSMRDPGQLDTRKFPTISFQSSGVQERSPDELVVTGAFTLHGVTRTVSLPVHLREEDGRLTADGTLDFRQTEYGIHPYSSFMGAVKNQDRITLVVHVVASR